MLIAFMLPTARERRFAVRLRDVKVIKQRRSDALILLVEARIPVEIMWNSDATMAFVYHQACLRNADGKSGHAPFRKKLIYDPAFIESSSG